MTVTFPNPIRLQSQGNWAGGAAADISPGHASSVVEWFGSTSPGSKDNEADASRLDDADLTTDVVIPPAASSEPTAVRSTAGNVKVHLAKSEYKLLLEANNADVLRTALQPSSSPWQVGPASLCVIRIT